MRSFWSDALLRVTQKMCILKKACFNISRISEDEPLHKKMKFYINDFFIKCERGIVHINQRNS